ncbi:hypothetical protein Hanom_Chr01g00048081 [Helianthus anomalus]
MGVFGFRTKMATKCKPQGPRCNKFEIWTKVAKLAKSQGPKWQFTLEYMNNEVCSLSVPSKLLEVLFDRETK